jgi:hypothetical protein
MIKLDPVEAQAFQQQRDGHRRTRPRAHLGNGRDLKLLIPSKTTLNRHHNSALVTTDFRNVEIER